MKIKWLILFFWICVITVSASNDTINDLVCFSDLQYNSSLEKQVFEDYFFKNKKDYLGLFLAIDSSQTRENLEQIRTQYLDYLSKFQNKKFEKSSVKKKINILYDFIYETYFTQYELIILFNDIFTSSKFNCVTATALYSIFMHDLNIPFIIKENPVHVYLVGDPMSNGILIETTDPQNRIYNYDFRTKSSFAFYLVASKIITEGTLKTKSIEEIFNKYFYSDEDITLDQLIGIHYMNHAAYLLDDKKTKEAFRQLEKAYLFYPSDKNGFILFTALSSIISNNNYKDFENIEYLFKLPRYTKFNITNDNVTGEFIRATNNILIEEGNEKMYNDTYHGLVKCIEDSLLIKDITFIYQYETGRYCLSNGWLKKGVDHIEKAFSLKPTNSEAMSLFIAAVAIQIRGEQTDQILNILNDYLKKYPLLIDNDLFHGLLLETYLLKSRQYFDENNIDDGFNYLEKFELSYEINNKLPVSKDLIVQAYSAASVYYFKRGNYNQSKKYLQKGLDYVPGSSELKYRMMSF